MENEHQISDKVLKRIKESEQHLDKIRGSLFGGAVGDALGYTVEFWHERDIFDRLGPKGIQQYIPDRRTGKALISDDTQMTLFTANGILVGQTRAYLRGIGGKPSIYVPMSYQDWLMTQEMTFEERQKGKKVYQNCFSWLADVPELYSLRAPGNTCLSALMLQKSGKDFEGSYIDHPVNRSKGCGGIMRVAPMGLVHMPYAGIRTIDREGAELAAITHGHSLGYMPAAVLTHILSRIVYSGKEQLSLREIVLEARDTVAEIFGGDRHLRTLTDIIDSAVALSENKESDLDNIHRLGEGWIAEETLGISVYCALRHQNDFSAGVIAAVNHSGDSDSTGRVAGIRCHRRQVEGKSGAVRRHSGNGGRSLSRLSNERIQFLPRSGLDKKVCPYAVEGYRQPDINRQMIRFSNPRIKPINAPRLMMALSSFFITSCTSRSNSSIDIALIFSSTNAETWTFSRMPSAN